MSYQCVYYIDTVRFLNTSFVLSILHASFFLDINASSFIYLRYIFPALSQINRSLLISDPTQSTVYLTIYAFYTFNKYYYRLGYYWRYNTTIDQGYY